MAKNKKAKSAEIIFAVRRFPKYADKIKESYLNKVKFDDQTKEYKKLFNKLTPKETNTLTAIVSEVKDINNRLSEIDENLILLVSSNRRFIHKRQECLETARKRLDPVLFSEANSLITKTNQLCAQAEIFDLSYSRVCSILSKINKSKKVVQEGLNVLETISTEPKKHFRYLYKDLNI